MNRRGFLGTGALGILGGLAAMLKRSESEAPTPLPVLPTQTTGYITTTANVSNASTIVINGNYFEPTTWVAAANMPPHQWSYTSTG